jgi:hypothetical protein
MFLINQILRYIWVLLVLRILLFRHSSLFVMERKPFSEIIKMFVETRLGINDGPILDSCIFLQSHWFYNSQISRLNSPKISISKCFWAEIKPFVTTSLFQVWFYRVLFDFIESMRHKEPGITRESIRNFMLSSNYKGAKCR